VLEYDHDVPGAKRGVWEVAPATSSLGVNRVLGSAISRFRTVSSPSLR
jgi:hypothetical protein